MTAISTTSFDVHQLLVQLVELLAPALMLLASYLSYIITAWLRQRLQNEKAAHAATMVAGGISDIVAATGRDTLEAYRLAAQDGEVTSAEIIVIRDGAIKAIKAHVSRQVLDGLRHITDNPDEYLWTKAKAEAHLQRNPGEALLFATGADVSVATERN